MKATTDRKIRDTAYYGDPHRLTQYLEEHNIDYREDSKGLLYVQGDINLRFSKCIDCSMLQIIEGNLFLNNSAITDLFNLIEVGGNLDCENCKKLPSIPKLTKVRGYFDISFSTIKSIPLLEYVGHHLFMQYSYVKDLPKLKLPLKTLYMEKSIIGYNKTFITKMMLLGKTFYNYNERTMK